ncbi:M20 family metallopeptidase [Muriicola marianensis]|uniref:Carboxypeptidase n=1 Tax=Muriicola marianensis TaxID=1324801 RepID=A0ABQ1R4V7_9FLAO|nr:M20 family metallopeptidase [Muriicola marianensis]GGD58336.1 carboxypeptidase [Muriicola marianensis]
MKTAGNILNYLNSQEAAMKLLLKDLVLMESPSREPNTQTQILVRLEKELNELGFFTMRMPGRNTGGFLYGRPDNRKKNKPIQLLLGHCDTVWKRNTLAEMPVMEHEGKLKGPGVYDMKAGLTQVIFALKAIRALGMEASMTPVVLFNSDEEIGSIESTPAIKKLARISERAYVLEPPLDMDGKLKTARKGLGRFTIKVHGIAAHAGLDPGKGVNAIVELSHQVQQLYAMNDFEKGITVNVGMIEGGVSANVVAPESRAVVDVRVENSEDGDRITEKILGLKPSLPDVKLEIEGGIGRPPMERNARNQELWKLAQAKALCLGMNLSEGLAGGGSDGNTTSMYTATLDGLGVPGDGAHATHEFIFTDQLPKRTALLALLLLAGPK